MFKPAEAISELSTFANCGLGDVLLTVTPSGCALRVPPPHLRRLLFCFSYCSSVRWNGAGRILMTGYTPRSEVATKHSISGRQSKVRPRCSPNLGAETSVAAAHRALRRRQM